MKTFAAAARTFAAVQMSTNRPFIASSFVGCVWLAWRDESSSAANWRHRRYGVCPHRGPVSRVLPAARRQETNSQMKGRSATSLGVVIVSDRCLI